MIPRLALIILFYSLLIQNIKTYCHRQIVAEKSKYFRRQKFIADKWKIGQGNACNSSLLWSQISSRALFEFVFVVYLKIIFSRQFVRVAVTETSCIAIRVRQILRDGSETSTCLSFNYVAKKAKILSTYRCAVQPSKPLTDLSLPFFIVFLWLHRLRHSWLGNWCLLKMLCCRPHLNPGYILDATSYISAYTILFNASRSKSTTLHHQIFLGIKMAFVYWW